MRRRAGTSGPYSVGRPQREQYNDGGSPLVDLWHARPYSDTEPPHPNADPDPDLDAAGAAARPARPTRPPRSADAKGGKEEKGEPELDYDDDLSYGTPLWAVVAPLVDGVTNLMKNSDSDDKLHAILESRGVANAKLVRYVVERATRLGFGFRYVKKDWKQFLRLVPSCTLFKQDYWRDLLAKALTDAGTGDSHPFANQPSDMGFQQKRFGKASRGGDPQEVYEERVPGRVPGLETRNIEGWLSLYRGETAELEEGAWDRIVKKGIVDSESGRFSTDRLQSALRYAFEMPDSPFAMALISAVVLREALRLSIGKGSDHLLRRMGQGDPGVTAGDVLSGMSRAASAILEKWLSVAVSSLSFVGALPPPESGSYDEVRGAMRRGMADIAVGMLRRFFKLAAGRVAPRVLEDARREFGEGARHLADDLSGRAREAMAAMEERTGENAGSGAARALRGAMRAMYQAVEDHAAAALAAAADAIVAALRSAGVEDGDGLAEVRLAAQKMRPQRSASTPVADIAKRIVSPAQHRVVTREEAEDGIEVGVACEGLALRLPARYHAVSQALAPPGGH